MMQRSRGVRSLALGLSLLGLVIDAPNAAHAGGISLYEIGTAEVGLGDATPVTEDYKERDIQFTGRIHTVTVEVK